MSKEIIKKGGNGSKASKTGKLDMLNINTSALTASLNDLTIPRLFYQLVVFVLDGSGSMSYPGISAASKGEEVDSAVRQVIKRLVSSKNKNSFDINIWAYANESVKILETTPVTSFDLKKKLDPLWISLKSCV